MKKLLIILVALIVAAIAGLPYVNGVITQKIVTAAFEDINQMNADTGSEIRVEIIDYDRGISDSRIEWRMDFGNMGKAFGLDEVLFVENATHGFFGVASETRLEKNKWFEDWIAARQDGKNPLTIHTRYPVFGPITSNIRLDKLLFQSEGETLNVGALEFTALVDRKLNTLSSKGKWDGVSEGESIHVGPMTLEAAYSRVTDMIWEGQGAVRLEKAKITDQSEMMNFSGLVMDFDTTASEDKTRLSMDMGVALDTIVIENRPFSDWSFRWGIDHIDIPAYESIVTLYSEIMSRVFSQAEKTSFSAEEINKMMIQAMAQNSARLMAEAEKLLKKDFQIRVSELNVSLPQGRVEGGLALGLKKDMTMAQFFPLTAQPSLALDIFFLKSDVRLPEALAGHIPNLIQPIFPGMKTGLFVKEGTDLLHRAETRDSRLFLNGEEVSLD